MERREFIIKGSLILAGLFLATPKLFATRFPRPTKKDRCPVCGMYVWKHKKHMAGFVFKDGKKVFFCSTKCMFHAYHNFNKYFPGRKKEDLKLIWVTEYYTTKPKEATHLYYVIGTDIIGPMGYMIVPVEGKEAAEILKRDHHGSMVLRFQEVTEEIVQATRKGRRIK